MTDTKTYDEKGYQEPENNNPEEKGTTQEENTSENSENKDKKQETVSLSKYMSLKKKFKELEKKSSLTEEQQKALDEFMQERKNKQIQEAYNEDFSKLVKLYPELEDKKQAIFELSALPANAEKTLEEIALETYKGFLKKPTVESENKAGSQDVAKKYDFDNLTPEQEDEIRANPEASEAYGNYLNSLM